MNDKNFRAFSPINEQDEASLEEKQKLQELFADDPQIAELLTSTQRETSSNENMHVDNRVSQSHSSQVDSTNASDAKEGFGTTADGFDRLALFQEVTGLALVDETKQGVEFEKPVLSVAPTAGSPLSTKKKTATIASNIIFFIAIVAAVLAVLTYNISEEVPRSFFGYSFMTVLSASMEDTYPERSLIVIKSVENLSEIAVGDDITFLVDQGKSTVTHRVVNIFPNYNNTGKTCFQTQGTMNGMPDPELVVEGNVVGKVLYVNKPIGNVLSFIKKNITLVIFVFAIIIALSFTLRIVFEKEKYGEDDDDDASPKLRDKLKKPKDFEGHGRVEDDTTSTNPLDKLRTDFL